MPFQGDQCPVCGEKGLYAKLHAPAKVTPPVPQAVVEIAVAEPELEEVSIAEPEESEAHTKPVKKAKK